MRFAARALALTMVLAGPVAAEGVTLRFEGGIGLTNGQDVGIFLFDPNMPDSSTSQFDFVHGMPRGPMSLSYRAEGNWAFDLGNGTQVRLGGILSGSEGTASYSAPVYYLVSPRPGGPGDAPPLAEIRVCAFPNPCAIVESELSRAYHEVMPELMFGGSGADGSTTWIGLQGFSGKLTENTSNRGYNAPTFPAFDRTTLTELDADATGVLLAVQHERALDSGLNLLFGAGFGQYRMTATGVSVDPAVPGDAKPVSGSFDGQRAQLSVGIEKPISKGLSLGASVRADYWTDQPRIRMDWTEEPCTPTVCNPPSRISNFDLVSDPFSTLTFGLSLTLRM